MKGKVLPLCACLVLGACAVGEDYQKPPLALDKDWEVLHADKQSTVMHPGVQVPGQGVILLEIQQPAYLSSPLWWERFNDPKLTKLIEKARVDNNDLKIAQAHIAEARGNARVAGSALLPQVNGTGSTTRSGNWGRALTPADTVSQLGLSGSIDIDIFGGDRRNIEAAENEVQATQADYDRAMLSVINDVATNYVQLRSLQQQKELTIKNLNMQKDTLKVTLAQRKEGAVSDLEVARARAQVKSTAARLPQIDTAAVAALNRLSVLTGEAPTTLNTELVGEEPIPVVPVDVVVETPIQIIENRPDIQASERRLAESTALTGVALAQLYPKLTLQGFFGSQFSHLYGYSAPYTATANALMPLLDWGRLHGLLDAANARQIEAFYTYQQTVLLALEQIENALTAYINEQERQSTLVAATINQRKATEVAREQYKVGATTQLDLLTAENSQLDTENDLTLSNAALTTDLIQLYYVLGEASFSQKETETPAQPEEAPQPAPPQ
jgi:NodT family efflux transporter outer membrane factor (OMF) lipoprotein